MGFILRRCSGKGPHLVMMGKPRGFSLVVAGFSSFEGEHREPLVVPQGSPVSTGVVRGTWGLLSSHCRANRPHLGLCPETPCSSPVVTGISWLHSRFTQGVSRHLELRREPQGSSPFLTPISGYLRSWQMGVRPRLVLRHGTPLALALFVGCQATFELYLEPVPFSGGCNWGVNAPSCCDFILGVTFEEVPGYQDLP